MALPTHCIHETGNFRSIYDHAPNLEAAQEYADRMWLTTGKEHSACTLDEFCAASTKWWIEQGPLREIDEESYMDMLECLPPLYRRDAMRGFFMCEFTSGTVTAQYVQQGERYFTAQVDITDRATWITPDRIAALDAAKGSAPA